MQRPPTFLEAPGQKLACGVPTFLRFWGRRVQRLAGQRGSPRAAVGLQSPGLEESLCGWGLRTLLWIYSGPIRGSKETVVRGSLTHEFPLFEKNQHIRMT